MGKYKTPFSAAVALGIQSGITPFTLIGKNPDVDIAAAEDIFDTGGAWTPPSAGDTFNVVSNAAADAAAGTGARTVKLYYADENWALQTEDITMNGETPVPTVATDIAVVYKIEALTFGSGGTNAGAITAVADANGGATATMIAGNNVTFMAVYPVPAGFTLLLSARKFGAFLAAGTEIGALWEIKANSEDDLSSNFLPIDMDGQGDANVRRGLPYDPYIAITEKKIVKVSIDNDADDDAICTAFLQGYLVNDTKKKHLL